MTDRHAAARAALEAALAATSSDATEGSGATPGSHASQGSDATPISGPGPRARRPKAWQPIPGDPESDLRTRDREPDALDVARQIVLRQLAMAPKSRKQLRDKLQAA